MNNKGSNGFCARFILSRLKRMQFVGNRKRCAEQGCLNYGTSHLFSLGEDTGLWLFQLGVVIIIVRSSDDIPIGLVFS